MSLTLDEVRKIASLARLGLGAEEERRFVDQLGAIVDYIDQLKEYPTAELPASAPSTPEADDLPRPCLPREVFLANAPAAIDGLLLVPAIKGSGDA